MDQHSSQLDNTAAASKSATSNTIDFNTVIDLKEYAGKNAKLQIDSTVNERNTPAGTNEPSVHKEEKGDNEQAVKKNSLPELTLFDGKK